MKLLLHTCCAPCSVYCIKSLRGEGIEPVVYWFNPNIHPYIEYKTRRDTLKEYTKSIGINAIFDENYGLREFCKNVVDDLENRCVKYCYRVRLEQTAKYAKENGYDTFSTTLLISPYQNHEALKKIGEEMAEKYGLTFLYRDFRPGFKEGQTEARELGLYMQKYCGCIFSEESRYLSHNQEMPKLPHGFEFLPVKHSINIKKEIDNKEQYLDLLLEADPSKEMVNKYLSDGELFVLTYNDEPVCIAVTIKKDSDTVELKNIVTKENYRENGYAKKMIKYLVDNYKTRYKKMIVGTTQNNIPFYVKQGFDKYEKTIKNFFTDNYDEEIKDGILNFELSSNRMSLITTNGYTIIDDSYNANFDSMSYAIKYLGSLSGRSIAVLGTMKELGSYSEDLHKKIGIVVKNEKIDILVTVGDEASYINEGAIEAGYNKENSYHFKDNKTAIEFINTIKKQEDNILVKASNSMNFKEIVDSIK